MSNRTGIEKFTHVQLLETALDQSSSGIIVYEAITDDAGRILTYEIRLVNRRAEQLMGMPRSEMLGQSAYTIFPQSIGTNLWQQAENVIRTGRSREFDLFYRVDRSGFEGWLNVCIEPVGDGRTLVVSFNDITELRTAVDALRAESILFKTLSSSVPETGVLVVDFFQKITIASGQLPGLLMTMDEDELQGKRMYEVVLPDFREDWKRYIATALQGEEHHFSDHWAGWRCECYVGPVRNERGHIVMALIVFKNVTEQYKQQQALLQMNQALRQSNESLEQFAYVASHDLQEPVRKIKAFGELLIGQQNEKLNDFEKDLLKRMQSAAGRMGDLITSLLSFARLSSRQQKRDFVSLSDLFSGILSDLEVSIQEQQAIIRLQPPLPTVPGDEQQLRQLFQNLLTNALKFTRPSTPPMVTVTARLVESSAVQDCMGATVSPQEGVAYTEIRVSDNGIGIAPEDISRIFGLFTRLHGRSSYEGSGIGLATVKKVIDNHHGCISVESEPDKGSTFRIFLPMSIAMPAAE